MTAKRMEIIDPKLSGARKLNLRPPLFDEEATLRAEQAMEDLSGELYEWMEQEVVALAEARVVAHDMALSDQALDRAYSHAHDIKGVAATCGFPLLTDVCASLCALIETKKGKDAARACPGLFDAHVDAARACISGQVKSDADPVAAALLKTLQDHVAYLEVAPK